LLGSGSENGNCPALYATDSNGLIAQGDSVRNGTAVLVPYELLNWAEPGTRLMVETTDAPGVVLIVGEPVTDEVRKQLTLDPNETAVEVPACER
jgi:hypothetical protein